MEIECALGDEDAFGPIFEMESGEGSNARQSDVGLTVHRQTDDVLIKVWKCRWRWVGKLGRTFLHYDIPTGTYAAPPF